jgi:hypothetical protein
MDKNMIYKALRENEQLETVRNRTGGAVSHRVPHGLRTREEAQLKLARVSPVGLCRSNGYFHHEQLWGTYWRRYQCKSGASRFYRR